MINNRRFLAVIPARGGSVSVPKKNIKSLAGKPLLVHTIDQAAAVSELDMVVVSTDDAEIEAVAAAANARVVRRPRELATNDAPTEWALIHALDTLAADPPYHYVVVLEPTSPLRSPSTIRRCLQAIAESDAPALVTVRQTYASLGNLADGRFIRLDPAAPRRRQDRKPLYYESSTVYVATTEHLRRTGSVTATDWLAVLVDEDEAVDINSESDFLIADILMREKRML
jgi:CMP-N,N'-diacetyllegionaminic acid synthase